MESPRDAYDRSTCRDIHINGPMNDFLNRHIIHPLRGQTPDVYIEVFGICFHVHSSILELHSAWFRDSLALTTEGYEDFQHGYISIANADGSWQLEKIVGGSITSLRAGFGTSLQRTQERLERTAFDFLLAAMYGRPFCFPYFNLIDICIRQGDFYDALPCLSRGFGTALFGSTTRNNPELGGFRPGLFGSTTSNNPEQFGDYIRRNALSLLLAAQKLRNDVLYCECLVHVVGRWALEKDVLTPLLQEHPEVLRIVEIEATELLLKQNEAAESLITLVSSGYNIDLCPPDMSFEAGVERLDQEKLPEYYRNIYHYNELFGQPEGRAIDALLRNHLRLDDGGDGAGIGMYRTSFLCTIPRGLPWVPWQS